MAIDKVFSSAIDRAVSKVSVPELGRNVQSDVVDKTVRDIIAETAQRVGDEILSTYNRVITTKLPNGSVQKTTIGLNEVKFETIENAGTPFEYVSKYKRTTHRGTYEADADTNGLVRTVYTSPSGRVLERRYQNGKSIRLRMPQDILQLEARHEASKGTILRTTKHRSPDFKSPYTSVDRYFMNGNSEVLTYDPKGQLCLRNIRFADGTSVSKDVEYNLSRYLTTGKNKYGNSYCPMAYHKDVKTGALTFIKAEKVSDKFSPYDNKVRVSYEFPECKGIKNAELIYTQDRELICAVFTSKNLGKVVYTPESLTVNGKELSDAELFKISPAAKFYTNEGRFEIMMKNALETEGICRHLMPNLLCW